MPNFEHFRQASRIMNFTGGRKPWYSVIENAGQPAKVTIFDEIGWQGVTAADFVAEIDKIKGPVNLHLASEGGEVFDGLQIYNSLIQRGGGVSVFVESLAASIASIIAQAADPGKLLIAETASMMIHDAQGMAGGSPAELGKMMAILETQSENLAGIYARRTGQTAAHWRDLMRAETWYTGQAAVDAGLADGLIPSRPASATARLTGAGITNAASVPWVRTQEPLHRPVTTRHSHDHAAHGAGDHDDGLHLHEHEHGPDDGHHMHDHEHGAGMGNEHHDQPDTIEAGIAYAKSGTEITGAASVPYAESNYRHVPVTVTHEHDHAAHGDDDHDDGVHSHRHAHVNSAHHDHHDLSGHARFDPDHDGDDDSTPEGDTDHDFWTPDGKRIGGLDGTKILNADGWDGNAAMTAASNSKNPASAFREICAGKRSGDPSERQTWALPHHARPGAAPSPGGVRAALARFSSAQGLINKDAALAHLHAHMKAISPDWKPEDGFEPEVFGDYTDEEIQQFAQVWAEALKGAK